MALRIIPFEDVFIAALNVECTGVFDSARVLNVLSKQVRQN
jgi:hypothetical protein